MKSSNLHIPFSLDFAEHNVDFENQQIVDGIFKGFKFERLGNGTMFFKFIDNHYISTVVSDELFDLPLNKQEINGSISKIATKKEVSCVKLTPGLDESTLLKSFIFAFAKDCAKIIWQATVETFMKSHQERDLFSFKKTDLPSKMLHMPPLFYQANVEPLLTIEESVFNNNGEFSKVEKFKVNKNVKNVLQDLEENINFEIFRFCKDFEKDQKTLMDAPTQQDLKDLSSLACLNFFSMLEKSVSGKNFEK